MSEQKKILRLNNARFDEKRILNYAYKHLSDNSSPMLWKMQLMYFIIDWLSQSDSIEVKTSGSTSNPKTMKLNKKFMETSARKTLDFFDLQNSAKILLCLPIQYIAAKMMVIRAFVGKLDLYCIEPKIIPVIELVPDLNFAAFIPAQLEALLQTGEGVEFVKKIKKILLGGSAISQKLANLLQNVHVDVWHSYGTTETMSHIALRKVNGYEATSWFSPLKGVQIEQNQQRCLVITAPDIGVYQLVTHDVVEINEEGCFKVFGRTDNVINSGGVKLFPEIIEQKLSSLINANFYVTSINDEQWGEVPVVVVESESWTEKKIQKLLSATKKLLTGYENPKAVIFQDQLRRTNSGKIIRERLSQ